VAELHVELSALLARTDLTSMHRAEAVQREVELWTRTLRRLKASHGPEEGEGGRNG
jgi:hypothetical protein